MCIACLVLSFVCKSFSSLPACKSVMYILLTLSQQLINMSTEEL